MWVVFNQRFPDIIIGEAEQGLVDDPDRRPGPLDGIQGDGEEDRRHRLATHHYQGHALAKGDRYQDFIISRKRKKIK